MARVRRGRDIHGILVLDKPVGCSSNDALQRVRRLFTARKAGHTGTLDMHATGVLPLCFGHATKISSFLLDADKIYRACCRLGIATTTGDSEGDIIKEQDVPEFTAEMLEHIFAGLRGSIKQIPPMYSALRHNGQRLYKLARDGIAVTRKERTVKIHDLRLEDMTATELEIYVVCSKGTYIRTLVESIGNELGCGAHLTSLRRLQSGPFTIADAIAMEDIEKLEPQQRDAMLLPVDAALQVYPDIIVSQDLQKFLCQGQAVLLPRPPAAATVRLYDESGYLFGVGKKLPDGRIAPGRIFVSSTDYGQG